MKLDQTAVDDEPALTLPSMVMISVARTLRNSCRLVELK